MRIRGSRKPLTASPPSLSFSPSSSSSSYNSSITASHSLSSSQDSSSTSYPLSLFAATPSRHRCRGLDLLVKAIHQVKDGSVVGFPYIQRRVVIRRRRRRRCSEFEAFLFDTLSEGKKGTNIDKSKRKKSQEKNSIGLRSGIQDSVLLPWGKRSGLAGEMGL